MKQIKKNSKELNDVIKAVNNYIKKHKGEVAIVLSMSAFKGKKCEVIDDIGMAYGYKEVLTIGLDEFKKELKKEKEEFVSW